jgi:hypothetical protein
VNNERVPCRAIFRGKDSLDGNSVEGIRAQPIDSLGGKNDKVARAKSTSRLLYGRLGGGHREIGDRQHEGGHLA